MPCLEEAIATLRAALTWATEVLETDADAPEAWSNAETRTHTILAPRHPTSRLAYLRELVHAALCEEMPRLYCSGTVWGVSLAGQFVVRKFYLRAARQWFAAARLRGLCPEAFDAALAEDFGAAHPRLAAARPLHFERLSLGADERQRLEDGLLLACARRWLSPDAPAIDPKVLAVAGVYATVDPERPDMPGFLALANGLCAVFDRRPFTPQPRKGYWLVQGTVE